MFPLLILVLVKKSAAKTHHSCLLVFIFIFLVPHFLFLGLWGIFSFFIEITPGLGN